MSLIFFFFVRFIAGAHEVLANHLRITPTRCKKINALHHRYAHLQFSSCPESSHVVRLSVLSRLYMCPTTWLRVLKFFGAKNSPRWSNHYQCSQPRITLFYAISVTLKLLYQSVFLLYSIVYLADSYSYFLCPKGI